MVAKPIYWEDVKEGDLLPPLNKEVTATTVIYGALASRDFMPVHHDRDFARKLGMKDIFMNSVVTGGWISRYVTDWTGPEGEIKKISMQFRMPCHPGDRLSWRGRVMKKYVTADEFLIDIEYYGDVPEGRHCSGFATVSISSRSHEINPLTFDGMKLAGSPENIEAFTAFMEKRKPDFKKLKGR
jgi:acyl dehydratase